MKTIIKPEWLDKYNDRWNKFKEWWFNLETREKQALVIGSICVGCFIFYMGLFSPLLNHIDYMRKAIVSEQKKLLAMQAIDIELQKNAGKAVATQVAVNPVTLLDYLQKIINQTHLTKNVTQLKQMSSDTIGIHFDKVPFDKMIEMLITVTKNYRVTISQTNVVALNTLGIVNADVTLKIESN